MVRYITPYLTGEAKGFFLKIIGKTFYIGCFLIGILPLLGTRSIASEPKGSHTRVYLVGNSGDWQVVGEVFIKPNNEKNWQPNRVPESSGTGRKVKQKT